MPSTPAHRPVAKKTKPFEVATAGLSAEGQAWFFQQRFECASDCLHVRLFGLRGLEGNPIVQVVKRHSGDVVRLLEHDDYEIRSAAIERADGAEKFDFAGFISRLQLVPEREWKGTFIIGPRANLPIEDIDGAWPILCHFVTLFPIFRAATDVIRGEDDRFQYYAERFWRWQDRIQKHEGGEDLGDIDHSLIHRSASPALSDALPDEEADREGSTDDARYSPQEGDRRQVVERQIRERRGQQQFRDALRKRYENRCVVTGCAVLAVLEAAHINPYRGENDNHAKNGLLLRADIHTLFDLDLLAIEPNRLRVELHPDLAKEKEYGHLDGKMLHCARDQWPSQEALRLRYEQFQKRVKRSRDA
jgi:hypothetical protein